jgi:hypothetical protein
MWTKLKNLLISGLTKTHPLISSYKKAEKSIATYGYDATIEDAIRRIIVTEQIHPIIAATAIGTYCHNDNALKQAIDAMQFGYTRTKTKQQRNNDLN